LAGGQGWMEGRGVGTPTHSADGFTQKPSEDANSWAMSDIVVRKRKKNQSDRYYQPWFAGKHRHLQGNTEWAHPP